MVDIVGSIITAVIIALAVFPTVFGAMTLAGKQMQKDQEEKIKAVAGNFQMPKMELLDNLKAEDLKDDKVYQRVKELAQMQQTGAMMSAFSKMGEAGGGNSELSQLMPLMMMQGIGGGKGMFGGGLVTPTG